MRISCVENPSPSLKRLSVSPVQASSAEVSVEVWNVDAELDGAAMVKLPRENGDDDLDEDDGDGLPNALLGFLPRRILPLE